jgi:DNA-binding IclR family transcriptional regulator
MSGIQGTQVVGRVALVLRVIARTGGAGLSLAGIVRASGLTRPTVHRLLKALAADGLLDFDEASGRWHLGPELYVMGTVAAGRFAVEHLARPALRRLAEATGESAFLSIRRGEETVCLAREEGSFPVRSFVLYEGKRFPLGVASAGIAILAFLPAGEAEPIIEDDRERIADYGPTHAAAPLRERLAETRELGYSVNPGLVVEGSYGLGAAVFDPSGRPAWALSLTGIEPRFRPARREELGQELLAEAHRLSTAIASPRP